jgi:GTP-binding protein EngB required for normal cell division
MTEPGTAPVASQIVHDVLGAVEDLCKRHEISALENFLESCRAFAEEKTLNIVVLGRFNAGKSSFLNHLLGQPLLPIGVIPVTTVVTEIQWGPRKQAAIAFADGRGLTVPVDEIGDYISESENPENAKQVARVRVELPSMDRYRGMRFVDTPGLESVFEHNTGVSLEWLPNAGLALVAVGIDTPLSQHDIELIRGLGRYTPNISLLLTKVDVLNDDERAQVHEFVRKQLARYWNDAVPVFPYSIRPGFEHLRAELDNSLLSRVRADADGQRAAILLHKLDSLLTECAGYLNVALKAAELADSERDQLRLEILGQKESLDDTRLALRLIVRHAMASTRSAFETLLRNDELPVRQALLSGLDIEFPAWTRSLRTATGKFDGWMRDSLTREMGEICTKHRNEFAAPAQRVSRQLSQSLQDFRNRLSERVLETLGVPLRTTELELLAEVPGSPDVRVGAVFDHNWELLSWLIPMALVQGAALTHFHRMVGELVFTNLSRLASQWADIANASLLTLEKESIHRLDGLVETIEKLIASTGQQAPRIRGEIECLEGLRRGLNCRGPE